MSINSSEDVGSNRTRQNRAVVRCHYPALVDAYQKVGPGIEEGKIICKIREKILDCDNGKLKLSHCIIFYLGIAKIDPAPLLFSMPAAVVLP